MANKYINQFSIFSDVIILWIINSTLNVLKILKNCKIYFLIFFINAGPNVWNLG